MNNGLSGVLLAALVQPSFDAEVLAPVAEQFVRGRAIGGNLGSWEADDANPRNVQKYFVLNFPEPFIRVNLDFVTTKYNPMAIYVVSKVRMIDGGGFRFSMDILNWTTGRFDTVLGETPVSVSFVVFTGSAGGNLRDYIGSSGSMRGQLMIRQVGPTSAYNPRASFETGNMVVTG